ncbi:hypothetical protein B0H19DRAFT_1230935 [Mycena capillaripes]|nr:hypothetical protein B0H19DRAFT_1230935 [Mycena capillaripes]
MPDKPPDMFEPAWIHLVFDSQCQFCWTKGVRVVEWRLRVRICAKCIKITKSSEACLGDSTDLESLLRSIIPRRLASDVQTLDENHKLNVCTEKGKSTYLSGDYETAVAKYSILESPEDRNSFTTEQKGLIKTMDIHAGRCEEWAQANALDRTQELEEIRKERQAAIIEKLVALGYEEDIKRMEYPQKLKDREEFTRTQPLTECTSSRHFPLRACSDGHYLLRPEGYPDARNVEGGHWFDNAKRAGKAGHVRLFRQYKNSHLPYDEIMPGPVDLCNFSPVKAILNPPADAQIKEAGFSAVVPLFDDFVRKWPKHAHLRLLHHAYRAEEKENRMSFLLGYDEEDKNNTFNAKPLKQF